MVTIFQSHVQILALFTLLSGYFLAVEATQRPVSVPPTTLSITYPSPNAKRCTSIVITWPDVYNELGPSDMVQKSIEINNLLVADESWEDSMQVWIDVADNDDREATRQRWVTVIDVRDTDLKQHVLVSIAHELSARLMRDEATKKEHVSLYQSEDPLETGLSFYPPEGFQGFSEVPQPSSGRGGSK